MRERTSWRAGMEEAFEKLGEPRKIRDTDQWIPDALDLLFLILDRLPEKKGTHEHPE